MIVRGKVRLLLQPLMKMPYTRNQRILRFHNRAVSCNGIMVIPKLLRGKGKAA
jgi:hypothetical protein